MGRKRQLLLLCDYPIEGAATVREHIDGLIENSRHHIRRLSIRGRIPQQVDLARFDGVIVHYSLMADMDSLLTPSIISRLSGYNGVKAVFVQDEHRNVCQRITALQGMASNLLFTCVPAEEIEKVYPDEALPGIRKVNVLTGYTSIQLARRQTPDFDARPIDIGYRARKLPFWLGRLGQEKAMIGDFIASQEDAYDLQCDISMAEHDRIYGSKWVDFLSSCKATLGAESGASVFDWDGSIERSVKSHLLKAPYTTFDDIEKLYLKGEDGKVGNGQISPRVFEAAALRTLMILYPGEYSGILVPWHHYVPLEKDHSNIDEVMAVLRNKAQAQQIIEAAWHDIACNPAYTMKAFVEEFDTLIDNSAGEHAPMKVGYQDSEWTGLVRVEPNVVLSRFSQAIWVRVHRTVFRTLDRLLGPATVTKFKHRLRQLKTACEKTIDSH
ncbi:hypothetical protein GTQ45_01430 [Pyruvatibacter mobilis]|uniref:Glycosyl transferase CAP10 domain-containing protein n=1 Tax=Pyruvatibacter mobilis TaxID=1712261 RepID=A0A845Q832_9HYPH|nr:hypothetical protein [Pyruvatibacter mobilis]NBG94390.1 hypothetical protein [Pyruvatibacter mobilis]QJD76678.1 hypothetical protein HG718_15475 [Pyruvatibacter mobilis]GGD02497.1 hypothetical protein GCM10011587_02830 [Pyruvatibacter mobilis]